MARLSLSCDGDPGAWSLKTRVPKGRPMGMLAHPTDRMLGGREAGNRSSGSRTRVLVRFCRSSFGVLWKHEMLGSGSRAIS